MSVCGPCDLGAHWLCNRAPLVACSCDDPSHDDKRQLPKPFGERE